MLLGMGIRFADFEFDPASRELRRNGVGIHLQRQAFEILALLVSRPGVLVTRMEIRDKLWPDEPFGDIDSRLNFQIRNIRSALGDDPDNPVFIATVPRSGYKFIAPIGLKAAPETNQDNLARNSKNWFLRLVGAKWVQVLLLTAFATISIFMLQLLWRKKDAGGSGQRLYSQQLDSMVAITSVSPILPQASQQIQITGRGFGSHVPFTELDTPFLTIRNKTVGWTAGRIVPDKVDQITVSVDEWKDSKITISGFGGAYGKGSSKLNAGDLIEISVWNPQDGSGPATFYVKVVSTF